MHLMANVIYAIIIKIIIISVQNALLIIAL